jgi:hypothetical protein
MEILTLNGKEYVSKVDFDLAMANKEKPISKFHLISPDTMIVDECNVLALGFVQIGEGYVAVKLSVEYLERVIKCLKSMSCDPKKGLDSITLAWAHNFPAVIGRPNDKGEICGFVIAPQVDKDEKPTG